MLIPPTLIDHEHVVGRMKTLELLERSSPYRNTQLRVEARCEQALARLPVEHKPAALFLYSTVLYLSAEMMDEAWRSLWYRARMRHGIGAPGSLPFMLELDGEQLKDELFRATDSSGRLHLNLPIRSASDIIDVMISNEAGSKAHDGVLDKLRTAPTWILLTDIALSGTSLVSELRRLKQLFRLFGADDHKLLCLCQVATETAIDTVRLDGMLGGVVLEVGIRIPNGHALNHPDYNLLRTPTLIESCHALCRWFADQYVVGSNYRLEKLAHEQGQPGIMHYGFGQLGWNVVTHKNAPNNSLPLLWFQPPDARYRPPFERIDSRTGSPAWDKRGSWLADQIAALDAAKRLGA